MCLEESRLSGGEEWSEKFIDRDGEETLNTELHLEGGDEANVEKTYTKESIHEGVFEEQTEEAESFFLDNMEVIEGVDTGENKAFEKPPVKEEETFSGNDLNSPYRSTFEEENNASWGVKKAGPLTKLTEQLKRKLQKESAEDTVFKSVPELVLMEKKKRKMFLYSVIGGFLGIFVLIYLLGGIESFSSPRKIYLRAEQKSYEDALKELQNLVQTQMINSNLFLKDPYTVEETTQFSLVGKELETIKTWQTFLNGLTLERKTIANHEMMKYANTWTISRKESAQDPLVIDWLQNQKVFTLKSPQLSKNEYQISLEDIHALVNNYNLNVYGLPKTYTTTKEYLERFDFLKMKDVQKILERYGSLYFGYIENRHVIKDQYEQEELLKEGIEARRLEVHIGRKEVEEIMTKIIEGVSRDKEVYALVKKFMSSAILDRGEFLTDFEKEFTFELYQNRVTNIMNLLRENEFYSDLEMILYIDDQNRIVKRELKFYDLTDAKKVSNQLILDNLNNGKEEDKRFFIKKGELEIDFIYRNEVINDSDERTEAKKYFSFNQVNGLGVWESLWPIEVILHTKEERNRDTEKIKELDWDILFSSDEPPSIQLGLTQKQKTVMGTAQFKDAATSDTVIDFNTIRSDKGLNEALRLIDQLLRYLQK